MVSGWLMPRCLGSPHTAREASLRGTIPSTFAALRSVQVETVCIVVAAPPWMRTVWLISEFMEGLPPGEELCSLGGGSFGAPGASVDYAAEPAVGVPPGGALPLAAARFRTKEF